MKEGLYRFLRKLSGFAGTDLVYLARGGFWLTLEQVVYVVFGLLLTIAFANLIPQETLGIYRYVLSVAGVLAIASLPGINKALIRSAARGFGGSIGSALKVKIKWALLGSLVGLAFAAYYFFQGNEMLAFSFLIVAAALPFFYSLDIYGPLLIGKRLFRIFSEYRVVIRIITVALLISVLFLTDNLLLILIAYFLPIILLHSFFLWLTLRKLPSGQREDKQLVSYGKHLSLSYVPGTIALYLDRILIFFFLGPAEVAIYYLAVAPPERLRALLKNIDKLALPRFSQRSKKELKDTILKKSLKMFLVVGGFIIIYVLAAPWIYRIFFPQYIESVFYSQIYTISLLAAVTALSYSTLEAKKAQKELYFCRTSSAVLQIVLLFVLIYFYGLLGAVLTKVISKVYELAVSLWLVKRF